MFRQPTNFNSSDDLKLRADRDEINTEHANLVLTRKTDSTIPKSTRDALDRLRAVKIVAARNANNGGNKRKSKKTNSRKKKRAPTTRRRRVKSIKHKKNVVK